MPLKTESPEAKTKCSYGFKFRTFFKSMKVRKSVKYEDLWLYSVLFRSLRVESVCSSAAQIDLYISFQTACKTQSHFASLFVCSSTSDQISLNITFPTALYFSYSYQHPQVSLRHFANNNQFFQFESVVIIYPIKCIASSLNFVSMLPWKPSKFFFYYEYNTKFQDN